MVFCVESGAKEAEGHGIVLVAAPLRLYWLLRRQKRAEHVGVGTGRDALRRLIMMNVRRLQ